MAWQTELVEILRVLINDTSDTPTYSDARLQKLLVVAAFQVVQELTFSQEFTVTVSTTTISPDPTAAATLEESFSNLVCIKAACILDRGNAGTAARSGIYVQDGRSAVDLRGMAANKMALLDKGWCAVLEDEKLEYQAGQTRVAGAAVMTPFRAYANGPYYTHRERDWI
jgi:hypothetical protein